MVLFDKIAGAFLCLDIKVAQNQRTYDSYNSNKGEALACGGL